MAAARRAKSTSKPRPELPAPTAESYAQAVALAELAPKPASVGRARFGTTGWSFASLSRAELFYPKGVKLPEARLRYYAEHFALVELDATFYALLAADVVKRWVDWTPATFCFHAKAHPVFTGHPIDGRRLPAELAAQVPALARGRVYPSDLPTELTREIERRYFDALAPVVEQGRLAAILIQFPPWFDATRGNVRHIESLRSRYPSAPFAVEFRNPSWVLPERRQRVCDFLRAQNLSYVVVDEPDVARAGVPPLGLVTRERLAVVRLHGQNKQAWMNPAASLEERFNYLYSPGELAVWAERIRRLCDQAEEVHVLFNNCLRNFAILNAKGLAGLLSDAGGPGA